MQGWTDRRRPVLLNLGQNPETSMTYGTQAARRTPRRRPGGLGMRSNGSMHGLSGAQPEHLMGAGTDLNCVSNPGPLSIHPHPGSHAPRAVFRLQTTGSRLVGGTVQSFKKALTSKGPDHYKMQDCNWPQRFKGRQNWAVNSAGECHLHTVEVTGSNPVPPTMTIMGLRAIIRLASPFFLESRSLSLTIGAIQWG